MDNLFQIFFIGGNNIIIDNDSSESDSDIEPNMVIPGENNEHILIPNQNQHQDIQQNMVIPGENIQHMLIPNQNQHQDHNYTVLNNILDIEENACITIAAAIQRDLQIFHFKIYLNDNARVNHNIYSEFEYGVNSNDLKQYIHENYISPCCANPEHVSIRRMHGSIFLNSIPNGTFNPDYADATTRNFLSPVYISPSINGVIFGDRYPSSYVSEHLHP